MCVLEGKCETCGHLVETPEAYDKRAASSLAFHRQDVDADGSFRSITLSAMQSCQLIGHCFALIACVVSHGLIDDVFHQPSTLALPQPDTRIATAGALSSPWYTLASASETPVTAHPARTTGAVIPTRCVGQLFLTTDSVKSAVV